MPTSDERREVAEALRGLRHRTYYNEEVVENIKDAIGIADPVNTFREPEDVYELIADLIDPTCHVVGTTSYEGVYPNGETHYVHELSCGHEVTTAWPEPPAYCPHCGSRVTDGGEG